MKVKTVPGVVWSGKLGTERSWELGIEGGCNIIPSPFVHTAVLFVWPGLPVETAPGMLTAAGIRILPTGVVSAATMSIKL